MSKPPPEPMRTIRVELDLPEIVIDEFNAAMHERKLAGLSWQTMETWLCNHLLVSLMADHQRRCPAPVRELPPLPQKDETTGMTRGQRHRRWLRQIAR